MSDPPDSIESAPTVVATSSTEALTEASSGRWLVGGTLAEAGGPVVLADRYELQGLLGEGGMGTVYLARDLELGERVALKVLRRELWGTPGALERFRREVRLARRVTHRNVARVYDIGEHGRDRFLTMEFVDGGSLSARMAREGRLLLSQAVEVARDVALGLTAAHEVGVLHRDLKPDNVLLDGQGGRAVITDFGVARLLDEAAGSQTVAHMVGTPAYMAPEQVEGRGDVDARADLYALGALLYEAVTGERPWGGSGIFAVATARLNEPPPDPRHRRPELPNDLAELILQLMARRREDRPGSAAEVAERLAAMRLPEDVTVSRPALPPEASLNASPAAKSLAVLTCRAFVAEDDYLAQGVTEDLIDNLSMIVGLRVRSLGAVLPYRDGTEDPRQVGRALGVQVVVGSSLRHHEDRLLLTVRLISVTDGFQLWAQRFECSVSELFDTSAHIAQAIAGALRVTWAGIERRPPSDPRVLELYLRGRQEYHRFWPEHLEVAAELLKQAHLLAPNDPVVMSAYALALSRLYALDHASAEIEEAARRVATQAAALAPQLAEPHVALATLDLNAGRSEEAARALAHALRISPQSIDAQEMLGRVLIEVGRPEQGLERLELVTALEPRSAALRYDMAKTRALLDEWPIAEALLEMIPAEPALQPRHWTTRARLLMWRPETEAAERLHSQVTALRFDFQPAVLALVALLSKPSGGPDAAQVAELVRSRALHATTANRARAFFCQIAAEISAFQGDGEALLATLEQAYGLGLIDLVWLDRCPLFDPFRDGAEFGDLRARLAARAKRVVEALFGPE